MSDEIWVRTVIDHVETRSFDNVLKDSWKGLFLDLATHVTMTRGLRMAPVLFKRKTRKVEYWRMHSGALWWWNMTNVAHKVLNGNIDTLSHPTLTEQLRFWKPVLEADWVDFHRLLEIWSRTYKKYDLLLWRMRQLTSSYFYRLPRSWMAVKQCFIEILFLRWRVAIFNIFI